MQDNEYYCSKFGSFGMSKNCIFPALWEGKLIFKKDLRSQDDVTKNLMKCFPKDSEYLTSFSE